MSLSLLRQCFLFYAIISLSNAQDAGPRFARSCFANNPDAQSSQIDFTALQQLKADTISVSKACSIPIDSLVPVQPGELLYKAQLSGMAFEIIQRTASAQGLTEKLCLAGFEKIVELCFWLGSPSQGGLAIGVDDALEFRIHNSQFPPLDISQPAAELENPTAPIPVTNTTPIASQVLTSPQPTLNTIYPPAQNSTDSTMQSAIDCGMDLEPKYRGSSFSTEHGTIDSVISRYCNGEGKVYQGKGGPEDAFILWWSGISITYQLRLLDGAKPPGQEICKQAWNSILTKCLTEEGRAQGLLLMAGLEFKVYKYELVGTDQEPFLAGKPASELEKPTTPTAIREAPSAPTQTTNLSVSQLPPIVTASPTKPPPAQSSTNATQYNTECGIGPNKWVSWAKDKFMNERSAIDSVISRYCNGEGKVYDGGNDAFIRWWSGIGITYQLRLLNGAPPPGQAMCKDVWNGILAKCLGEGKGQGLVLTDKYEFKVFDMHLIGTDKEPFLRPERVSTRDTSGRRARRFGA